MCTPLQSRDYLDFRQLATASRIEVSCQKASNEAIAEYSHLKMIARTSLGRPSRR
jgi:hypothetical protein